jgi:hypothetical protein
MASLRKAYSPRLSDLEERQGLADGGRDKGRREGNGCVIDPDISHGKLPKPKGIGIVFECDDGLEVTAEVRQ